MDQPQGLADLAGNRGDLTTAEGSLYRQVALLALLFFLVSIPCVGAWAALGAGASRFLMTPRGLRLFNVAMALLLVASLVPLLRD